MNPELETVESVELAYEQAVQRVHFNFGFKRRSFMQLLGAGLLIAASAPALAQQRGGGRRGGGFGGSGAKSIGARIHLGKDGSITVLVGKVEAGQGARAELTQAAAEELRVSASAIQLIMADTGAVPDDGITAGSGSTPRTMPAVRQGAAAARQLLVDFAAKKWNVEAKDCEVRDGKVIHTDSKRSLSYADLAKDEEAMKAFDQPIPSGVTVTPVKEWKVLGKPTSRPNGHDIVTGAHKFPSDISRPGMLYGKILRPPSYAAQLASVDLEPAKAMKDVVAIREEQFVGVAAPTAFQAEQALAAISKTAKWDKTPHPSSKELYEHLKKHAEVPKNPYSEELASAKQTLRQTYNVAYVQHSPLEPRAAVAEWTDGKLTVWAGTQNPFGHRGELARALHIGDDKVRVIVPDFGAGFGGKHSGETSVEAARLAQAAGKPVCLRWTREEEFTWAYFRPAGVIEAEASLNDKGALTSWHFININSGPSAVDTPYRIENNKHTSRTVQSSPPLRHGSYRGLAATANTFARECFMDELAAAAGVDPLEFRLTHLGNEEDKGSPRYRLRAVLEAAAARFDWKNRAKKKLPNIGVGLSCGTEKGSYVAACAEIEIDRENNQILVRRVTQSYECGAIVNPDNLLKQVQGALIMGIGPALREQMRFENGQILNASFGKYKVPRFDDVPELDIHLLDRADLPSAGAGETPIIAIAPAIANAVFHATGQRCRSMPITLSEAKKT
jgi:CO/xanthine dehydrogenase Mo-binding subunit